MLQYELMQDGWFSKTRAGDELCNFIQRRIQLLQKHINPNQAGVSESLKRRWGTCDFRDSARLFLPFLKNTFSKPSGHHGTRLCCTSPRLREPSNGPSNLPCEAYIGGPLPIKGPPGSPQRSKLIDLKTTDKLKNTAWFEVNDIQLQINNYLDFLRAIWPPS